LIQKTRKHDFLAINQMSFSNLFSLTLGQATTIRDKFL